MSVTREVTVADAVAAINGHLAATRSEWTPVSSSTRLDDIDLDSFEIANVLLSLEEAKGCRLDLDALAEATVVGDLAVRERAA